MTATTDLEQVNYPWPVFIKNTFLNGQVPRSQSFEEYFEERRVRSCPASMVDATAEPACDCEENVPSTRPRCVPAANLSATSSSTSTGSSSASNTERGSCSDEATLLYHSQSSDCQAQHPQKFPGLPEFEYPGPVFQAKGTFIHTDLARPFSLDEFLEDRNLRSCPGSVIAGMGETQVSTVVETTNQQQEPPPESMHPHQMTFVGLMAACTWTILSTQPVACQLMQPDAVFRLQDSFEAQKEQAKAHDSFEAQKEQAKAHAVGACRPCAHFHTMQGCRMGESCRFCHACPPGELKRRQKQRRRASRGTA